MDHGRCACGGRLELTCDFCASPAPAAPEQGRTQFIPPTPERVGYCLGLPSSPHRTVEWQGCYTSCVKCHQRLRYDTPENVERITGVQRPSWFPQPAPSPHAGTPPIGHSTGQSIGQVRTVADSAQAGTPPVGWLRSQLDKAEAERATLPEWAGGPPVAETALDAARLFHDTYERLAPQFGYETRTDTRAFDPESPNGRLMVAVCEEVMREAAAELSRLRAQVAELEQELNTERALSAALREGVCRMVQRAEQAEQRAADIETAAGHCMNDMERARAQAHAEGRAAGLREAAQMSRDSAGRLLNERPAEGDEPAGGGFPPFHLTLLADALERAAQGEKKP